MYKKHIKIEDESVSDKPDTGFHISHNDRIDIYLIRSVTTEPTDSYGSSFEYQEACLYLTPEDLDNLIRELIKMKDATS